MSVKPLQPQVNPLPLNLRMELPNGGSIPWQMSDPVFASLQPPAVGAPYKKAQVFPSDPEWRFVWRFFYHDKPTRYGIKTVHCVHNRDLTNLFEGQLAVSEAQAATDVFRPTWDRDPRASQRAKVIDRWKEAASSFSPFQTRERDGRRRSWTHTKVLPLWHGSDRNNLDSISKTGFAFFGKTALSGHATGSTDEGYFGSGIYFTNSPRYAADIYSDGHLMLSWVSMREPFPVVGDPTQQDMQTLKAQHAYEKYNAHYVPVVPKDAKDPASAAHLLPSNNPHCPFYYPCQEGEAPVCDEVVVFQPSQTLPRYWIELQLEHPQLGNISIAPRFVEDLIPHLFKTLENPEIDADKKLRTIFSLELTKLLKAQPDDDLDSSQEALFGVINNLIDTAGKVNKAVRQTFIGAAPEASAPTKVLTPLSTKAPPTVAPVSHPKVSPVPAFAFGAADWKKYFGDVGMEPPLPPDIDAILQGPCPLWPGRRVYETHLLTLVPETVNGKPFTLDYLAELIQHPQGGGKATRYGHYRDKIKAEHGNTPAPKSHWVLMTRDVLEGTRKQTFANQQAIVARYPGYEVPRALEAATAILMEHVKTGNRLYSNDPWTYTRCQEQTENWPLVVGGFAPGGLSVVYSDWGGHGDIGLAGVRKSF